tara:strand:- start:1960 stop:2790 length:831 start_codon:yes stop_codon:yes gene_type:complete
MMAKDAYYFSHDSNARNDQRLMKIRMKYGMEGYGAYFGIIEILREQSDYTLLFDDLEGIAFDLRIELNVIEDIVSNYDLFVIEGMSMFYSRSLKRRMECLDEKKIARAEAGRKGGIASAKVKQSLSDTQAVKKSKLKENILKKVNNNIEKRNKDFHIHCQTFTEEFGKETIEEFFLYWSEPNEKKGKMLFELQPSWDTKRRLQRWVNFDYGTNKKNGAKQHNFKITDGKNYLAWCSKCLKSSFYDPYNFNPDTLESPCCSAKILDEKAKNKMKANA